MKNITRHIKNLEFKLANKPHDLNFKNDKNFLFGFASAAAQIENGLDDIWLEHAKNGNIAGFNEDDPTNIRNNFWNEPEGELEYVFDTGVDLFRMGLDWERICPNGSSFDLEVIQKYKNILQSIKDRGIKTMVTLYHHSEPTWTHRNGSWSNSWIVDKFCAYTEFVAEHLSPVVDYWNTFNEIQMYITLTQLSDFWPPVFKKPRPLGIIKLGPLKGVYHTSMENVALAHNRSYNILKNYSQAPISVAHNLAYYMGEDTIGAYSAKLSWKYFNFLLIDLTKKHLDFLGINFYGSEALRGPKLVLSDHFEYSDSGRGVYPKGLYEMLKIFHEKYQLPIFITENGMSDACDTLREKYMVEHLLAVKQAMNEGVPVMGYVWWSMTDNLEWADGYAPKFGLVEVTRKDGVIHRKKRKSYELYKKIVQERYLTEEYINEIRDDFVKEIGKERNMTRARDAQTALSKYRTQPIRDIDWGI